MQSDFDVSIIIGGDAGMGVESTGSSFSLALARAGIHVHAVTDYRSRIRGGHNFYQIRVAGHPITSHEDPVHMVLALTAETVEVHLRNIAPRGGIIFDSALKLDTSEFAGRNVTPYPIPLVAIAEENGSKVMMNTAAQAAAAGLLGLPIEFVENVTRERFERKGAKVVEGNLAAARAAYDYVHEHWGTDFPFRVQAVPGAPKRMLINGNEALAMGAAAGGCRFIAAYPMTPGTTVFEWLTAHAAQIGIVTKQAEDEIAAALMVAGAGFAGARAMTSTSGGGFNLMCETVGMAGMEEIPMVLVNVQRGGPSTGLPTRTEQGDLLFVLYPSHGDFPRIVLAPGTIKECFTAGWRAHNLAEKYQCPVIILSDDLLATSLVTVDFDELKLSDVRYDRGKLQSDAELAAAENFKRFAFSEDGISPRCVPGQLGGVHAPSTDEHLEDGRISENIDNRIAMMQKRMKKMETALAEMQGPQLYGADSADLTLVCWGSLLGTALEAVKVLATDGISANVLHFKDMWPFPAKAATEKLRQAKRLIAVEQNYSGQLVQLIRMTTGISVHGLVTKYDGRPITPGQIAQAIHSELTPAQNGRPH